MTSAAYSGKITNAQHLLSEVESIDLKKRIFEANFRTR